MGPGERESVYLQTALGNLTFRHIMAERKGSPELAARVNSLALLLTQTCTGLSYATHIFKRTIKHILHWQDSQKHP